MRYRGYTICNVSDNPSFPWYALYAPDGTEVSQGALPSELKEEARKHIRTHQQTRVVFRIFPKGCGVIAVFPDEKWDEKGNLMSYIHIGQHGACSPDIASITRPATEAQYAPLLQELQRVGYENIKVCKRIVNHGV